MTLTFYTPRFAIFKVEYFSHFRSKILLCLMLDQWCGKYSYTESATIGTLFTKLKFLILKAFYITSTIIKETATLAELASEIELKPATLWTFKQKILALIEANKTKKKHKDDWTQLIKYSIK
jgi:hypothetical protein